MRVAMVALALLFTITAFSRGQTLGEITGEVHDPTGSVMVGAQVAVVNNATGAVRTAVTNDAGVYDFPSLQPGVYTVKVSLQGFQAVSRPDVELQVQQTARIDF